MRLSCTGGTGGPGVGVQRRSIGTRWAHAGCCAVIRFLTGILAPPTCCPVIIKLRKVLPFEARFYLGSRSSETLGPRICAESAREGGSPHTCPDVLSAGTRISVSQDPCLEVAVTQPRLATDSKIKGVCWSVAETSCGHHGSKLEGRCRLGLPRLTTASLTVDLWPGRPGEQFGEEIPPSTHLTTAQ